MNEFLSLLTSPEMQRECEAINEPLTSEDYMKLDNALKFLLLTKWAFEEHDNGDKNHVIRKLEWFKKPLEKQVYEVSDRKSGKVLSEYVSKANLIKELNLTALEFTYIVTYHNLKKPKYKSWNKYKIRIKNYKLKGNDYISI